MNQPNAICINIAEFSIKLFSDSVIELEEGYLPFVNNDGQAIPDINIECVAGLPAKFFEGEPVFKAENEVQKFYSIYRVISVPDAASIILELARIHAANIIGR